MASPEYTASNSELSKRRRYVVAPLGVQGLEHLLREVEAPEDQRAAAVKRTFLSIRRTQGDLRRVAHSLHPDDRAAYESVNRNFFTYDWEHMATDGGISRPNGEHILEYLSEIDHRQFLQFAILNVERQQEVQAAFEFFLPSLQAQTTDRVAKVVDAGILPASANKALGQVFETDHYVYHVMDSFEAGLTLSNGYCNASVIAVAHPFPGGNTAAHIRRGTEHTFMHEAGGHAVGFTGGGGLMNILPDEPVPLIAVLLEEPFVEHATMVSVNGRPDVLDPNERKDSNVYALNRKLLHAITTMGRLAIPLDLMGEAFMEDRRGKKLTARTELDRRLERTLAEFFPEHDGVNIMYVIAKELTDLPTTKRGDAIQRWNNEIRSRVEGVQHLDFADLPPPDSASAGVFAHIVDSATGEIIEKL